MSRTRVVAATIAYGALDAITHRRGIRRTINGESIRFPARWARYYPSTYQPATWSFLRAHCVPRTLAIDVGAHLGLFSVVMARAVGDEGKVWSYEPTPETYALLRRTISMNGCADVIDARVEAVSEQSGHSQFHATGQRGANSNSLIPGGNMAERLEVATVALDDVVEVRSDGLRLSCLKIDAEGAEVAVLEGAGNAIRAHRPAIALDVHPAAIARSEHTMEELWSMLRGLGMEVWDGAVKLDRETFCAVPHTFDVQAVWP